jgi:hypothetical protein
MIEKVTMNKTTLEPRIVAALGNPNNGSEALTELIHEVEQAAATAEETAKRERTKAIDLTLSPDLKAAHEAVVEAELARERLSAVLPKLRENLAGALEAERHARWLSTYHNAKTERDALAREFADSYPAMASQLVDLFNRMQQCDRKCLEVDAQASNLNAEHRRLGRVELEARNLDRFTRDRPEIAKTVQLPAFVESDRTLWPCTSSGSFAAEFAQSMIVPAHVGPRWADDDIRQERRKELGKEKQRLDEFYQQQTAAQEERQNAEERERFASRP